MNYEEARDRIKKALDIAVRCGGIDGAHHKDWTIDQMVRALTGCPTVLRSNGGYVFAAQGESEEYKELVRKACDGEDGPDTYSWDTGIAP